MLIQDLVSFGNRVKNRFPAPLRKPLILLLRPFAQASEQRQLRALYSRLVSPGDLAFDIGAHTGTMTRALLAAGARVVAVDPQPACVRDLQARFGRNPRVTVEAVGVAEREGELHFTVCEKPQSSTFAKDIMSQRDPALGWKETIPVPVTTLDRLVEKYGMPRFCKIDVEGLKERVLEGLSRPLPVVSFEFHAARLEDARRCADRILALGPALFQVSLHTRHRFHFPEWVSRDRLFGFLETHPDASRLYGDVYARSADAVNS